MLTGLVTQASYLWERKMDVFHSLRRHKKQAYMYFFLMQGLFHSKKFGNFCSSTANFGPTIIIKAGKKYRKKRDAAKNLVPYNNKKSS